MRCLLLTFPLLVTILMVIVRIPNLVMAEDFIVDDTACEGQPNFVKFTHPNCEMYYICQNGTVAQTRCSDDYYYDRNTKSCAPYANVDCIGRKVPARNSLDYCPHPDGYFNLQSRCDNLKYLQCENNKPYEVECPLGTTFDWWTTQCVLPSSNSKFEEFYGNMVC